MFQTTGPYAGWVNGSRINAESGEVLDIPLTELGHLLRESPGIVDPRRPLTPTEAAEIRARRDQEAADAAKAQRAAEAAARAKAAPPPTRRYTVTRKFYTRDDCVPPGPIGGPPCPPKVWDWAGGEVVELTEDIAAWLRRNGGDDLLEDIDADHT